MPNSELEIHPYLNSINDENFENNYFENILIGSFPIYGITSSTNENGTTTARFNEIEAFMPFFYGSKRNIFWKLLSSAFFTVNPNELNQKDRVDAAKSLLIENNFLITDVLYKTNRNGERSEDSQLWVHTDNDFVYNNRLLNTDIIRILNRNTKIKYIYFTSTLLNGNSPFGWFNEIFGGNILFTILQEVENRVVSASITINHKEYIAFFLPSPAGNGTRGLHFNINRTQIFVNYVKSIDRHFFEEINLLTPEERTKTQNERLTKLRNSFLIESWRQVIVDKNINFDGTI